MSKISKSDVLETALKRFRVSVDGESDIREKALVDQKMENGDQWSEADKKARVGRPLITINKEAGIIKQITGDQRQSRPQIKVRPVDSESDPKIADVFNGLIRNIETTSDAEAAYDCGLECAARCGLGYWQIVNVEPHDDTFEQELRIKRISNPLSVYVDPSWQESDQSDARWKFIVEEISREEFERKYSKTAPAVDWDGGIGDDQKSWFTDAGVRIAVYWYKEEFERDLYQLQDGRVMTLTDPLEMDALDPQTGQPVQVVMGEELDQPVPFTRHRKIPATKIYWAEMCGSEILDGPNEWSGKYIPIIPCLGEEVWVDGKRELRSAIRHAHDAQRLYNWSRSNSVETQAMAPKQPYLLTPDQIKGHERSWATAYNTPRPYLLYNNDGTGAPQRLGGSMPDIGATQEASLSSDDIKSTTGLYDASLGARGNETSGRAILARQREGDTATYVFADNRDRAIKHTGRVLIDLIPRIYDTDRVVRILNEDGKPGWARINIQLGERKVMDLSVGKYDVVVDAGPGYMTRRMEAADGMIQIMQAVPSLAPMLVPKIAKNLDWPGADDLAEELQQMMQSQQQSAQQSPEAQRAMAEVEGVYLDNEKKKAEIATALTGGPRGAA